LINHSLRPLSYLLRKQWERKIKKEAIIFNRSLTHAVGTPAAGLCSAPLRSA
jgi:hypothetical protein